MTPSHDTAVRADERAKTVAWMRTFPMNQHAREWALIIQGGEYETEDPKHAAERLALTDRYLVP